MGTQQNLFDYAERERVKFNGPDYDPEQDDIRLTGQIERIFNLMQDGRWRTLGEIADATGDPPASVSAQLRHLRKDRFGAHTVEKRHRGERSDGLWEYRLIVNKERFNPQRELFE